MNFYKKSLLLTPLILSFALCLAKTHSPEQFNLPKDEYILKDNTNEETINLNKEAIEKKQLDSESHLAQRNFSKKKELDPSYDSSTKKDMIPLFKKRPVSEKTSVVQEPTKEERILAKEIKSILISSSSSAQSSYAITGIEIKNIEIPKQDKLVDKLQAFIGEPVTLTQLQKIKKSILKHYRNSGYPVVLVNIPTGQNVATGRLHFIVIEGKLGRILCEGANWFSCDTLTKQIRTKPGESINSGVMYKDLNWLNENPFRTVDMFYEKGEDFGEADAVLKVRDRLPLRVYGGYQNTGNKIASDHRLLGGFNWGNVWGLGHQLSYQYTTAPKIKEWSGHSAEYVAPLPWRNILKLWTSYTRSKLDKGNDETYNAATIRTNGKNWQFSGRYTVPYLTLSGIKHNFTLGYDFKRTNNFLEEIDKTINWPSATYAEVYNTYMDVSQFVFQYDVYIEDKLGSTYIEELLYYSPGDTTHYNKSSLFRNERPGAASDYLYGIINLERNTLLPLDFLWTLQTQYQFSGTKLLPSEQFSLGGYSTIRGYKENEVIGDNGFLFKNELRSCPITIFNKKEKIDRLQFLVFLDYGLVYDIDPNISPKKITHLYSIGPGLRYNIKGYFIARFDYGWQLKDTPRNPNHKSSRGHVSLTLAY